MTASITASSARRRPSATAVTLLTAVLLVLGVWGAPQAAAATPTTYQGATYPTAGPAPTEDKPQSKLWYTDGSWWALMRVSAGITIHRLGSDHIWRNTGTVVDERIASTGDALWEDGTLYVASRVSGGALRAIRLSYNASTDTYTREFSQQVAGNGTESMSITRDSLNRLWIAYTQGSRVYVAHTTTNNTTWTAPFLVPVPDNTVSSDDIASLVAFNGRVGVMWSDQGNDVIRFAVHEDSAPDTSWTMEDALSGPNLADDHINLKTLTQDSQGRVYAVVKTSRGDAGEPATDPSIVVLQRNATGTWTSATASQVGDKLTRAQIVLDSSNSRLYVLMATESGGTVYYKSAPLGALSFPTGKGSPFVQWAGASINDPSTAKHPVTAETGLVVLASDDDAKRYYHGEMSLGGGTTPPPPDTTPPTAPTQVTATPASSSSVGLAWAAATDNVGVTGYRITRNGTQVGTTAGTTYTDTGLAASTSYTYTVTAVDAAGNVSPASAPATATTPAGPQTPPPSGAGFVSASTATGSGTSTSVAGPAGVQAGDVLVAAVSVRGVPAITAPAGWTLVRTDTNGSTMRQAVYVRALTGTDGASTWTLSQAKDTVVQVVAYRGVDTASPVLGSAGAASTTATITSPAAPAVAGARVVTFAGIARTATLAPAAPLAERSEITTAGTAAYKVTANSADTTATGTTAGPYTTTANGAAGGVGQTVTLRPGGGGATPPPPPPADTTPPTAPTQVTATPASSSSVGLSWAAATDNVGVTGYRVLRNGAQVGTTAGTTYTDTGLAASTSYTYTVTAVDAAGNVSPASAPATATTPAGPQTPPPSGAGFVSASTATGSGTSTSVAGPAGVQAGDVLVAAVSVRGVPAITAPAGWTLVRTDTNGSTMRQAVYVRALTGTDGASTWTLSQAKDTVVQVVAYRGVDTASPVLGSAGAASTTATITSPAAPAVAGARVVTFAGIARTATLAPAAPLAERSEITTAGTAAYKVTANSADTTATGTTAGPYTTTANGAAGGVGQTVTLRPLA